MTKVPCFEISLYFELKIPCLPTLGPWRRTWLLWFSVYEMLSIVSSSQILWLLVKYCMELYLGFWETYQNVQSAIKITTPCYQQQSQLLLPTTGQALLPTTVQPLLPTTVQSLLSTATVLVTNKNHSPCYQQQYSPCY